MNSRVTLVVALALLALALLTGCRNDNREVPGQICGHVGDKAFSKTDGIPLICSIPDGKQARWYYVIKHP
jgi:outer membrane protein assembly factor BamE (lipoprotein component of BamABCDE complex)